MSRIHEAWIATHDERRAVAIGIGSTARVITTAAAIMVAVFLSFVANSNPTVKMLAVGMAFAVLIDASLVRMILVPAIMTLLGREAWWMPRWMEPIVPHLQLEGSGAGTAQGRQPTAASQPGDGRGASAAGPRTYSAVSSAGPRPGGAGSQSGDARTRGAGKDDTPRRDRGSGDSGG
jgi:hypothetical protein